MEEHIMATESQNIARHLSSVLCHLLCAAKSRRAGKLFICKTNPILTFKNEGQLKELKGVMVISTKSNVKKTNPTCRGVASGEAGSNPIKANSNPIQTQLQKGQK